MKRTLLAGAAALAYSATGALAGGHLVIAPGEGNLNWESYEAFAEAHNMEGSSLTFFGPWLAGEATAFENLVAYFIEATGIDTSYVGSDSLEQQIVIDAEAGSAPNLTAFPQPGLGVPAP